MVKEQALDPPQAGAYFGFDRHAFPDRTWHGDGAQARPQSTRRSATRARLVATWKCRARRRARPHAAL